MKFLISLGLAFFLTVHVKGQRDSSFCFNNHSFVLLNNDNELVVDAEVYLNGYLAKYDSLAQKYEVRYKVRDVGTSVDLPFNITVYHPEYDSINDTIYSSR